MTAETTPTSRTLAKRWRVRETPPAVPQGEWPQLIGRLLALRGVTGEAEARAFLGLDAVAGSTALPDLEGAVERLARACRATEAVAVFGDFDVDGITAATLLTEGLGTLGARPLPYLPHRESEGYGLNTVAIDTLSRLGATLLVTADCGTSSVAEVAHARSLGMDVIILDHHTVPPRLPLGSLIVNPRRDPNAADEPAACGIAYYVLLALYDALGRAPNEARMVELAALGTVCDLAPLVGENRRLVRDGLTALMCTQRPGLRALLEVSGANPERIDTETIGFVLGPRLNAAGRLAHARLAFDLLRADEEQAPELARQLDALNRRRQEETERATALAEELAADEDGAPLIMVGHEEFPLGIVGLVAARLTESHHRPAIAYRRDASESRASARSIPEFHITDALRALPEGSFVRFGGHRAAAGFTALNEKLPDIKERLLAHAEAELDGVELAPVLEIDVEQPLSALRGEEIRWLGRLAPHGVGNPEPRFLSRDVLVVDRMAMGQDGRHLRLKLKDGAVTWPGVAFRQTGDGIEAGSRVDVVYSLSAERFSSDGLELRVLDVRAVDNG